MEKCYLIWTLCLFSLALIPGEALSIEDEPFRESVIIFNTICAKCHEAQCSGRLSFSNSYQASIDHIVRHYDSASEKKWLQKELFTILNHMKEKCAYYPVPLNVPPNRIWGTETLEKKTTLRERNYFIPIGPFTPGHYNLEIELAKDAKITMHIISETFELVIEDCYQTSGQRLVIPFFIEETENYYLRVYPRIPVQITQLAISTTTQK
ncbi:MAG: hypothetical protein HOM14_01280 [Gammaproteobacteria bacterium]|jgi:hypothetical protein|nr:hypothetical protein [Gammaproteobacteria bacterium]MBT3722887.1 hypothetical protein [Gammaproteobacteria bacterium]MBT4078496.1 hypothetical protein [Gammaproteobacteria bacterium]MBT4196598.1 hypothetical protein [Gammaproteobacteria bacterium]MBT4449330.1 hypothetical protein [Gammaproteobacteria bacterium]